MYRSLLVQWCLINGVHQGEEITWISLWWSRMYFWVLTSSIVIWRHPARPIIRHSFTHTSATNGNKERRIAEIRKDSRLSKTRKEEDSCRPASGHVSNHKQVASKGTKTNLGKEYLSCHTRLQCLLFSVRGWRLPGNLSQHCERVCSEFLPSEYIIGWISRPTHLLNAAILAS